MVIKMKKKRRLRKPVLYIILAFFILLAAFSSYSLVNWYREKTKHKEIKELISEQVVINETEEIPEIKVDFDKLKETNGDTVAYLYVKGTDISYPVVKTDNNKYYLNHSYDKSRNNAGWIFMDYRNRMDGTDKNIIMYGHNRMDGIMFGTLKNVLTEEWFKNKENRYVELVTPEETLVYEVFSVYKIKLEDRYITTDFKENEFKTFINDMKGRSLYNFKIDVGENDQILTLSTCILFDEYRLVLHARLK